MSTQPDDNHFDDHADGEIRSCLDLTAPKSFFLYAGAGSGKTRSLVGAIRHVCKQQGKQLSLTGQKIAVITYTNAACDEIKQRLEFDPLVDVQTIHSFAWSLIDGYNKDIRNWVSSNLQIEIAQLQELQSRGRSSKASEDRAHSIEAKQKRLRRLPEIRRFTYSPTGDNRTRDALNHSEVIAMTADFLSKKAGLQRLLVARYPILLIDESQDTNRLLMDAFLCVQSQNYANFSLGLFGDSMQRIYNDGKVDLASAIPTTWAMPKKQMNHRCPNRVIKLINEIRRSVDGIEQRGRSDKAQGHVRLFVLPHDTTDKFAAEALIADRMATITADESWKREEAVKTLTLEHHMSARRFGFQEFFEVLYTVDRLRTGLLDGSLPGLAFFTRDILPLVDAMAAGDRFRVAAIVRSRSPLLVPDRLKSAGENQLEMLKVAKQAADSLYELFRSKREPTLFDVLKNVAESGLFVIPDLLAPFTKAISNQVSDSDDESEDAQSELVAWRNALSTPFVQIKKYDRYVRGLSKFDTHQGVKGLEFPRVMVIIADDESRGFLFSYDKLFGVKDKSKTDEDNEAAGRDTTIERTRRLFYVTCSRAEQSLAIVHYSTNPAAAKKTVAHSGWFDEAEIEQL